MTAIYDNLGIRFMYPDNWHLVHEQASGEPCEVSVESPGSGFWSVHVYRSHVSPDDLASQVIDAMREEYDSCEARQYEETIEGTPALAYEMSFYCLDFLVTARLLVWRNEGRTLLVLYQAEDREFDTLEQVFRAVTVSLFRTDQAIE